MINIGFRIKNWWHRSVEFCVFTCYYIRWASRRKKLRASRNHSQKPRLVWGPSPVINNKYWSNAMRKQGYVSDTLMRGYHSSINKKQDFDLYTEEIVGKHWLYKLLGKKGSIAEPYILFDYVINNYDIITTPYSGGYLGSSHRYSKYESKLLKMAGCKIIIITHGGDAYCYSRIIDPVLRHGLLLSYYHRALEEDEIEKRVAYWTKYADIIIQGFLVDGFGRWDVLPHVFVTIDTSAWMPKKSYSHNDGTNGPVTVVHAPNHRGFKGTEFIMKAVQELQAEGLQINFILIEKKSNDEVKKILSEEADILVDQLLLGIGLSAIEGMACGLAVLSPLEYDAYTRLFRLYSYLGECPILSTTHETVKRNIKLLVQNPALREELGRAGRAYVEKYHSEETAQYMFGKIYEKIWNGKDVDLLNMFHPVLPGSYNNSKPRVKHPLEENKLPADYQKQLNIHRT